MSLFQLLKKAIATNYDKEIATLQSMGFEPEESLKHLKQQDGNIELALQVKLSSHASSNRLHNYHLNSTELT